MFTRLFHARILTDHVRCAFIGRRKERFALELVDSFLNLCTSLTCVFAIGLAARATKEIERVDRRIDELSGEVELRERS